MKIVHLAAGAGRLFCGSCLQGNTLAAALRAAGHDVVLLPVYTPLRTDEPNVSEPRVAMGGLNVFLQQHSSLARHAPEFVDRWLDRPGLLARLGGSTRPERLGALTVSMLRGEEGRQRKEIDKLAAWLAADVRPDVVHLSTALLVGAARTLAERLDVPVVATLAGEDSFVEQLHEPYRTEAREELHSRCGELAALVAPSAYYAEFMADYLQIPSEEITVIPPGLNLESYLVEERAAADDFRPPKPREGGSTNCLKPDGVEPLGVRPFEEKLANRSPEETPLDEETMDDLPTEEMSSIEQTDAAMVDVEHVPPEKHPFRIGYFSRIAPAKGLHQLVEAFRLLLRNPSLPPARLVVAGHVSRGDRAYFRQVRRQVARRGLAGWFDYRGELDRDEKIAFLRSLDVLCVPATRPESRGLALLEGLAAGAPAVVPDHGVFSELIAETGGGLVYEPNRPTALAAALERMIRDPDLAQRLGRRAQAVVHQRHDVRTMAERMMTLYSAVCRGG